MSDLSDYRFRSSDTTGSIQITDGYVNSTVHRTFTKWTYPTPLAAIDPHPIRSWTTPYAFWVCFAVSACGIFGVVSDFAFSDEPTMAAWGAMTLMIASIGLLMFAFTFRREEWIAFPTSIDGHWVRYCRNGPDRDRFDSFTSGFVELIRNSKTEARG